MRGCSRPIKSSLRAREFSKHYRPLQENIGKGIAPFGADGQLFSVAPTSSSSIPLSRAVTRKPPRKLLQFSTRQGNLRPQMIKKKKNVPVKSMHVEGSMSVLVSTKHFGMAPTVVRVSSSAAASVAPAKSMN